MDGRYRHCRLHGHDHLWQDLGLWSRDYLSRLMTQNFPHWRRKHHRHEMEKNSSINSFASAKVLTACPRAIVRILRGLFEVLRAGGVMRFGLF